MIYRLVTKVIPYFCFPDLETCERWGHLGFLERGGILEIGGRVRPPLPTMFIGPLLKFSSLPNLIFCSGPPQLFWSEIFSPPPPPLKLGGLLPWWYRLKSDLTLNKSKDCLFIESKKKNTILGCFYKHPNVPVGEFANDSLEPLLEKLSFKKKGSWSNGTLQYKPS